MKKEVFIMSGPSWVGKTTVWDAITSSFDMNFEKIITTTTRKPRVGENSWIHYYFADQKDFFELIESNELIEYAFVHWNYYWSTYTELKRIINNQKIPLYIIDLQWAIQLKKILNKDYDVTTVFLMPPSEQELVNRLQKRWTEQESVVQKRLKESLKQMEYSNMYDCIIVNDNLENTIEEFKKIINTK